MKAVLILAAIICSPEICADSLQRLCALAALFQQIDDTGPRLEYEGSFATSSQTVMRTALQLTTTFLLLVLCDSAGRLLSWSLGLPVPGTVLGILMLLGALVALRRIPAPLGRVADFLLAHLNFFYIPAGVGVMTYAALLAEDLWPIVVALFASTFFAMIAAGLTFRLVARFTCGEEDKP
ncbi:MAG TPA: hypothetical protein DCF73_17250 [Rhodobiaceae bacterium]|nr:hypothetical protein [Rhodobiaceae bacterium]